MDPIRNPSLDNLNLLGRLDLHSSLTKLNLWRQIQYEKVVFLDADTVVLQNIDGLFALDVEFAAAPDIGWPDIFNSGVFFTKPNIGTYAALKRLADAGVSFDGGDQGLLNSFFPSFHRLSFTYNVTPSSGYQYLPAFRHFESQLKVAHFIGAQKPWALGSAAVSTFHGPYAQLLARWWAVYDKYYPNDQFSSSVPLASRKRGTLSPVGSTPEIDSGSSSPTNPPPFEAAQTGWNAQISSPPTSSAPEAAELQYMSYSNNWDGPDANETFVPPSTPKIPKSVHFEPPSMPDPSTAIFPWEGRMVAQRSFPEDAVAPLQEIFPIESREDDSPRSEVSEADHSQAFANYQFSNAWDSIQEIRSYVSSQPGQSGRPRAPSSTWGSGSNSPREAELPEGPSEVVSGSSKIPGSQKHVKTDFLLQEPAGLPKPQDWDPSAQLAQLATHAQTLARRAVEDEAARKLE